MIIFENLEANYSPIKPCVLSIGNFDGVHLGHQRILSRMRELAGNEGTTVILTFSNHPSHVLKNAQPTSLIYSNSLKINTLDEMGIDIAYCLEFTPELAGLNYKTFLQRVWAAIPFDHLVLGQGATLGNHREGDAAKVTEYGKELGFEVEYLEKLQAEEDTVSSCKIRESIQKGDLKQTQRLLGRPLMLEASYDNGQLNVDAQICLPPDGDYPVTIYADSHSEKGLLHIQEGLFKLELSTPEKKVLILFD